MPRHTGPGLSGVPAEAPYLCVNCGAGVYPAQRHCAGCRQPLDWSGRGPNRPHRLAAPVASPPGYFSPRRGINALGYLVIAGLLVWWVANWGNTPAARLLTQGAVGVGDQGAALAVPTATAITGPVGLLTPLANDRAAVKAVVVDVMGTIGTWQAGQGHTFLVADVALTNRGADDLPYAPQQFRLKDDNHYEYIPSAIAPSPGLQGGTLAAGEQVSGNVAFIVPTNAAGFVLSYDLQMNFGSAALRIRLGQ